MFGFFKKQSATPPAQTLTGSPQSILVSTQAPSSSISSHDVRIELVRAVLKDTVRAHGLPTDWLRAEPGPQGNGPLHTRIIMSKWSGKLLKYTMALERLVLIGLDRYEPTVDHSSYTFSWQFGKDCPCPFPTLPPPETWAKKKSSAPKVAEPVEFFERRKRPRHMGSIKDRVPPTPTLIQDSAAHAFAETTLAKL